MIGLTQTNALQFILQLQLYIVIHYTR